VKERKRKRKVKEYLEELGIRLVTDDDYMSLSRVTYNSPHLVGGDGGTHALHLGSVSLSESMEEGKQRESVCKKVDEDSTLPLNPLSTTVRYEPSFFSAENSSLNDISATINAPLEDKPVEPLFILPSVP
jgi:hypothetical protein